jgi:phosphohistidine phosphatase
MRQLLLLRHAKSSWDDPSLSDHARPLNPRGRRAGAAMGAAIRELGLRPDVVLVSSARRTLQTLDLIRPALEAGTLIEPMDAIYLAPWQSLLALLREAPETAGSVMIIGHNPGLHDLALALLGDTGPAPEGDTRRLVEGYPTGALAEFAIAAPWRGLAAGGGRLVRFLMPRDLATAEEMRA